MIRFKAKPDEKPAATPTKASSKAKPSAKAKTAEAAPREDLLDLARDAQDDKD